MINKEIQFHKNDINKYYKNKRINLLKLINHKYKNILEIGCGTGENLIYLKKNGANYTAGIELRNEVANFAAQHQEIDEIFNMDFENFSNDLVTYKIDTIIISHVLEHFADPILILRKIKEMADNDCIILIAVPNIRNIRILINLLLFGNFEYAKSGIMDYTHLKFYTKKSITNLLKKENFKINKIEIEFAGPKSKFINTITFGIFKEFWGYAININASKAT
jgi:2-polyprenyl-3-methyl-5-hydroxy-6-metoxy-1,4-benzoquinol methylase